MINCIPFRKACTGLPEGMHLISEKCALCKRNIHEALWDSKVSPSTIREMRRKNVL